VIRVEGLGKRYGDTWALKDVTMEVEGGRVLALLGPNGAGKTTLVRILITELRPSEGRAWVAGFDVITQAEEVRRRIAAVPQEAKPINFATPYEFVLGYLLLRGVPLREARRLARWALEEMGLWEHRRKINAQLSGGLKRRVLIAAVLAANAEVVFLDEPTTGLDPVARRVVWGAIQRMSRSGVTILLTTHYVEEAESLSDVVAVLVSGRLVAMGEPGKLVEEVPGRYVVEASLNGAEPPITPTLLLRDRAIYLVDDPAPIIDALVRAGARVSVRQKSLEHYVLMRTGARIGEFD